MMEPHMSVIFILLCLSFSKHVGFILKDFELTLRDFIVYIIEITIAQRGMFTF